MIASIGEALIDFIPSTTADGAQAYVPRPGGSPFNTAVTCGRLDHPTLFLTRLSNDFFGEDLVRHLETNNVVTDYLHRDSQPTTLAFVRKTDAGDAEYAFFMNDSADRLLSPDHLPDELPNDVRCIQCGSISLQVEPSGSTIEEFVRANSQERVIAYDPNIRPGLVSDETVHRERVLRLISLAGIVKISDVDLEWLYPGHTLEQAVDKVDRLGQALTVVTRGPDGSEGRSRSARVSVPAETPPAGIKDTVGAGDSFHGALLTWLDREGYMDRGALSGLSESTLKHALSFASRVAAITCSRHGAEPPRLSEL
ncbi:MAG: carbohydrate kinase family protein [Spirochaetales bacterium]